MFTLTDIAYSLVIFPSLLIGLVVLFKVNKKIGKVFSLINFLVAFWVGCNLLINHIDDTDQVLFLIRFALFGPILIAPLFLIFSQAFPNEDSKISIRKIILYFIPTLLLLPFTFTEYNVKEITFKLDSDVQYKPGILYVASFVFLVIYISYGIFLMAKKYNKSDGFIKSQLKFVAIGFAISFSIGLVTALILPVLGVSDLSVFAPVSPVFFSIFAGYTILRHRFFDIKFVIGKSIYLFLLAIILYLGFYLSIYFQKGLWGTLYTTEAYITGFFIALVFTVFILQASQFITRFIELSHLDATFLQTIGKERLVKNIAKQVDIESISKEFIEVINSYFNLEKVSLIIYEVKDHLNDQITLYGYQPAQVIVRNLAKSILKTNLKEHFIILDELKYLQLDAYTNKVEIIDYMEQMNSNVIILNQIRDSTWVMISLGEKPSNQVYSLNDVNFINSIIPIVTPAIGRALLHEEVEDFNRTLQQKVTEATFQLQTKNQQLEESLRKEKDLIDILSHELRTPASIVRNALSMLEMEFKPDKFIEPEKLDKWLDMSLDNIRRLASIIETMLAATKLDSNRIQVNLAKISAKEVLTDSFESLKSKGINKGLAMNLNLPQEEVLVMADKNALVQILDNLIDNAIKYTPTGFVDVTMEADDMWVKFIVKDSGKGIPAEEIPKLGRKFYRVDNYLSEDEKNKELKILRPDGTGIGLYVVKGLLNNMGGRLEISSEGRDKGSTFTVFVPIYKGKLDEEIDSKQEVGLTSKPDTEKKAPEPNSAGLHTTM